MKCRLLILFLVCLSSFAFAQSEHSAMSADAWQKLIRGNALNTSSGAFQPPRSGFALYFSRAGNVSEPYLVYVPKSYNPLNSSPVVVFLHGAILAKDSFQYKDPSIANEPIFTIGETLNTIVVFPFARTDFKWSGQSPAFGNIISIVKQVERDYNVDKKKVFIGGISMGLRV